MAARAAFAGGARSHGAGATGSCASLPASETRRQARLRITACRHAQTGTAAGAAFAGKARSHRGEVPPDPVRACLQAKRAGRRVSPLASTSVPDGSWDGGWRRLRGQGPLAQGRGATGSCASLPASETRRQARVLIAACRHAQTGTAAGAAFAGKARSHRGGCHRILCELACKRNAPAGACPDRGLSPRPNGDGGGRRLRGQGPLAQGRMPPDPVRACLQAKRAAGACPGRDLSPCPNGDGGGRRLRGQGPLAQGRMPPDPVRACLQAKRAAGACPHLRLPRCLTEAGTAAAAAFAGKARSHKGEVPPEPLCELACKRNAPQARVPTCVYLGA
jgi:hypothetical protein